MNQDIPGYLEPPESRDFTATQRKKAREYTDPWLLLRVDCNSVYIHVLGKTGHSSVLQRYVITVIWRIFRPFKQKLYMQNKFNQMCPNTKSYLYGNSLHLFISWLLICVVFWQMDTWVWVAYFDNGLYIISIMPKEDWAEFHNHLIRFNFNPNYFMQHIIQCF